MARTREERLAYQRKYQNAYNRIERLRRDKRGRWWRDDSRKKEVMRRVDELMEIKQ